MQQQRIQLLLTVSMTRPRVSLSPLSLFNPGDKASLRLRSAARLGGTKQQMLRCCCCCCSSCRKAAKDSTLTGRRRIGQADSAHELKRATASPEGGYTFKHPPLLLLLLLALLLLLLLLPLLLLQPFASGLLL